MVRHEPSWAWVHDLKRALRREERKVCSSGARWLGGGANAATRQLVTIRFHWIDTRGNDPLLCVTGGGTQGMRAEADGHAARVGEGPGRGGGGGGGGVIAQLRDVAWRRGSDCT